MSAESSSPTRRSILVTSAAAGTAAMTVAAAQFGMIGSAAAQSNMKPADIPAVKPGTNTSFAPLKQNDAGSPECWIR